MSSCSILDKEETHYVPLVVFCEALHLHQESIQWQTMQTAPTQFAGLLKEWLTRVAQRVSMFTIEIHGIWLIHDLRSLGNNDQNTHIILLPLKTLDSSWCLFPSTNFETDTEFTRCGTLFLDALRACWRQNGMETAASSAFLFLAHKAKHTKTNRISRFGLHNCGFRQLPPHMLALVAQLLSNATIKPLQLQQSELVSHVVTTLLKSTCLNRFMFP